uniref:YcgJ protein n=1 Tax=Bacillus subtilis TaxID=1423 RepID=P94386_BACIU|nr:ycgJ [Bacillus subtilis]
MNRRGRGVTLPFLAESYVFNSFFLREGGRNLNHLFRCINTDALLYIRRKCQRRMAGARSYIQHSMLCPAFRCFNHQPQIFPLGKYLFIPIHLGVFRKRCFICNLNQLLLFVNDDMDYVSNFCYDSSKI